MNLSCLLFVITNTNYVVFVSDYVSLMLSGGSEEENVREKLKELVPSVRNIANEFKKPQIEKS